MPTKTNKTSARTDTFQVRGDDLIKKVKELIHEGNIRKITILDRDGNTLIVLPLTIGVIGAVIAAPLAAVGALAALVTDCTIKVDRSK